MAYYSNLSRAQLSFEYLHTNSTTHEFLFGALAELVDNSRDASATRINIYTEEDENLRGGFMVCFLDDGEGMDPNETADIITFGKSTKKALDSQQIGMYGNGLKSGSMRIGNDLILFTKKVSTMSCLFLSRTFHEEEGIDEVVVPIPSFDTGTKTPLAKNVKALEKHDLEMSLILKYSPFKSEEEFFSQFDKIQTNTGTLVIIYNLKLLDSGEPELDIWTDTTDIILSNPATSDFDSDEGLMPERKSFRAYTAMLYMDPRMKIYIQNKKVRTKRLQCALYKPRMYKYSSSRFRTRSEYEARRAEDEAKIAAEKAREADSKAKNMENRIGSSFSKDQRVELRKTQSFALECRKEAQMKRQIADRKQKSLREPKLLSLLFGVNIENRSQDGVFVYNCSRLIKMYEKVGPQTEGGVCCSGIVGIVDVPYLVLEPTHNKQDFADAKEFRHLMKAMGEHMENYWNDIAISQQGITKFWENFGYISSKWRDPPTNEPKYARRRGMQVSPTLQCDLCLKWRTLPFSTGNVGRLFPDDWVCSMNSDQSHNRCSASEQKMNIPESFLKKESKTKEQKQKDLEEEIRKKQEKLLKMKKVITSSRQLKNMEEERLREEERQKEDEKRAEEKKKAEEKRKLEEKRRQMEEARQKIKAASAKVSARQNSSTSISTSKNRDMKTPPVRTLTSPNYARSRSEPSARTKMELSPSRRLPSKSKIVTPKGVIGKRKFTSSIWKNEEVIPAKWLKSAAKTKPVVVIESDGEPEMPPENSDICNEESETPKGKHTRLKREEEEMVVVKNEATVKRTSSITVKKEKESESKNNGGYSKKGEPFNHVEKSMSSETIVIPSSESEADVSEAKGDVPFIKTESKCVETKMKAETAPAEPSSAVADDGTASISSNEIENEVGLKVEALVNDKWYSGKIVKLNNVEQKWKVKFDNHPRDKYDKWYDKAGPDIRILKSPQPGNDSVVAAPASPASISSHDTSAEAPSSSTAITNAPLPSSQVTEEIGAGYRTCLRYFLPPHWIMDKESVSNMSLQELAAFPLDDFFDHYEKGLRKLVGKFQSEAAMKTEETEILKNKLSALRKLISRLLKTINEDFDIDPECDESQVDELLATCVRQATQTSKYSE